MKKYIPYIIITILLIVIAIGATYIIMDHKKDNNVTENNNQENNTQNNPSNKTDKNEETKKEDKVAFKSIKEIDNTIVEEFEITLNGKTKSFKIKYILEEEKELGNNYVLITGTFNNDKIYYSENDSHSFKLNEIKEKINEDNFKFIKGSDNKSYLLVQTSYDGMDVFDTSELYVYNDELELISKNLLGDKSPDYDIHHGFIIDSFSGNIPCGFENNSNPLYSRTFKNVNLDVDGHTYDKQYIKIEDNKIYYQVPQIDPNDFTGYIEERVYTINNNKFEYKVIKTIKITEVCQQI